MPNSSASTSQPINPGGPVLKMTPLTLLQIAVKDNVDVLYFSAEVPMNVLFTEDGNMGEGSCMLSYNYHCWSNRLFVVMVFFCTFSLQSSLCHSLFLPPFFLLSLTFPLFLLSICLPLPPISLSPSLSPLFSDRKVFLATWKEIPPSNEVQSTITNVNKSADAVQQKLEANNIFTIARRNVDTGGQSQELIYMSAKFVNNIWVLMEVKVVVGDLSVGVSALMAVYVLLGGIAGGFSIVMCGVTMDKTETGKISRENYVP